MTQASIVIPTFKRPNLAFTLAKHIRQFDKKLEIIIVDQENNHPPQLSETNRLKVRYLNLKKANTSAAKNKGIEEAKGDIIIFFDDDVEITNETIRSHLRVYEDSSIVGIAGRVINDHETVPKETLVETGKTNFFGTRFLYQFWSTKKQSVDFVYGCNMSFRKNALKKIGGFDDKFPKIFEEVDLSKRIKQYGSIRFEPNTLVYHHKAKAGGIRPEEQRNKQKLIFENYGRYLAKNIAFPFSFVSLLLRIRTAFNISPSLITPLVQSFFSTFCKQNLLFLAAFALILLARFWKVPQLFNFTFSEEMQALMAWEQIKHFHRIWIGVSAANINYYLGPGFTYLNFLLFKISKDPAILAYFATSLGILTTLSVYFVAREIFNKRVALYSFVIYGLSTLINFHDRRFWNPSPIPFITIWLIYSLYKAKKDTRWYILTFALIGSIFHTHLSLLLFIVPAAYSIFTNIKKISPKTWILMICVYLIITSPLIVFDFVHNFDNFLMPVRTLMGKEKAALYPFSIPNTLSHVKELLSALGRLWFIRLFTNPQDEIVLESHMNKTYGNILLSLLTVFSLVFFLVKNRKPGFQLFMLSIVTIITAFVLYPSYNPEYYLMSLLTLTTIAIGYTLDSLPNSFSLLIITVFIIANLLSTFTMQDTYGLITRKKLLLQTMSVLQNHSFAIETYGELPSKQFSYAGWRYLFKTYGKTPTHSNIDEVLGWLYPDETKSSYTELKVIVSDTVRPPLTRKPLYTFQSGPYYADIYPNF